MQPAGYAYLMNLFDLKVMPIWHLSQINGSSHRMETGVAGEFLETFPQSFWPGDGIFDHLEFALKYDGIHLDLLWHLFGRLDRWELTGWIAATPLGRYTRTIWYLYEWMTGERLDLNDLKRGNYFNLLDEDRYYTAAPAAVRRQRIRDNQLGPASFCPVVRKTETLARFERIPLQRRCAEIMADYPAEVVRRAAAWLYTKETKSSFEIERVAPDIKRTDRFVTLLQSAAHDEFLNKAALVSLQNQIVDARYAGRDYRASQNYVGETVGPGRERIHFIGPCPGVVNDLMEGLIQAHRRMEAAALHPVVHAAAVAFALVFIHPFEDGNGRMHRFLIHNILARRQFTPAGMIFPVSAAMLRDLPFYDRALEVFSRPLLTLIDYRLDEQGRLSVTNDTRAHYRFMDLTAQAEALFEFVRRTIETELVEELDYLSRYDRMKLAIQAIVDMPDRKIDLMIRCCRQNGGRLSDAKRKDWFAELDDREIQLIQEAVSAAHAQ